MIIVFFSQVASRQPVLALGLSWESVFGQGSLTVASFCIRMPAAPAPLNFLAIVSSGKP